MKNCKAFCKAEAVSHLNEVIQATPQLSASSSPSYPLPDKTLLRLEKKRFLFKVLQECRSWASRNGAVQILF